MQVSTDVEVFSQVESGRVNKHQLAGVGNALINIDFQLVGHLLLIKLGGKVDGLVPSQFASELYSLDNIGKTYLVRFADEESVTLKEVGGVVVHS